MNSKFFKINYKGDDLKIVTNYSHSGEKLILFLHGLGCAKESFNDIFQFSQFDEFSILIPDLIGFGDSSKPRNFSYNMEEQAEICKLLLDKINPTRIHIVAHSMGGAIGILLSEKILDKLISFTNIEGNLISEDCGLLSKKTINVNFKEFNKKIFDQFKAKIAKLDDNGLHLLSEWIKSSDPFGFYHSAKSLVKLSDSGELLRKFTELKSNKIYVYGNKNSTMKILGKLKNIEKISISKSGHFVMNDNPQEFYNTLSRLLEQTNLN